MGRRALSSAYPLVRQLLVSLSDVLRDFPAEEHRDPQERGNNRDRYGTLGTARLSSFGSSSLNATACENQCSLGGDQSDYVRETEDAEGEDVEHHQDDQLPDAREKKECPDDEDV